jgi:hypothetical protein
VADEIVVDLMRNACGVDYREASRDIAWTDIKGVRIPFASARSLLRMKQTVREKDAMDRVFLRVLLSGDDSDNPAAGESPTG